MNIQKIITFFMLARYWSFLSKIVVINKYLRLGRVHKKDIIVKIILLFLYPIILGKLSLLFGTKPILLTTLFLNMFDFLYREYVTIHIILDYIPGLSELIIYKLLADASNLSNPVKFFSLIDFPFYIIILLIGLFLLGGDSIFTLLLPIINFIIVFIFFKETNTNIGIDTDIISYIKIFSNPLVWSFLIFYIGWRIQGGTTNPTGGITNNYNWHVYYQLLFVIALIIQGTLFEPLSKFFGLNKLVIIGMIFVFLAILFWWLDKVDIYEICMSLSFGLVIPSLSTSIINTYDYKNYGLVLGALMGLQSLGWYIGDYLSNYDENEKPILDKSASKYFFLVSLVIFLIYGRTGVNLLEK